MNFSNFNYILLFQGLLNIVHLISVFVVIYFIYAFLKGNNREKHGKYYYWFNPSSNANPLRDSILTGRTWTSISDIKHFSNKNKKKEKKVYFHDFRLDTDYKRYSMMPGYLINTHQEKKVWFDAKQLTKGVVGIGSAGSGKTEFLLNVMNQHFYKKSIWYSKKGDFEIYFYRPVVDYLLNPKLEEGSIHDILSEDVEYIIVYLETLMNASLGKNQDYFSGAAKDKLQEIVQRIKVDSADSPITIKQKWENFITYYYEAVKEAEEGDQKSQKDVMSTVKAVIKSLKLMAYRVENGAKTFTVKEYFDDGLESRLFLSATDPELEPNLAATFAVLVKYQLSLRDISTYDPHFFTAYFLDEYLSISEVVDDTILLEISRVGRSKGMVPFKFFQSFPVKQEERLQIIANFQYLLIFSIVEPESIKILKDMIKGVKFERTKISKQGKSVTESTETVELDLIDDNMINKLEKDGYNHICFAPKEELLYKAYTPVINLKYRDYINWDPIDMNAFYKYDFELNEELKNISKDDKDNDIKINDSLKEIFSPRSK
jgi:hypothetical protein